MYECQRRYPFVGWASSTWSAKDYSATYVLVVVRRRRGAAVAPNYAAFRFPALDAVLPRAGFQWAGAWRLDCGNGAADGWEYAFDFGTTFTTAQSKALHNVRRRRWVRAEEKTA